VEILFKQVGFVQDIGKPPVPIEIVPRAWIKNPDQCCRSWRGFTKQLSLRHFARHRVPWVQHVTEDAGDSIDVMLKLDTPDARSLSGWDFDLTQLMCMCHTDGITVYPRLIPVLELIDWIGVSDSTWNMMSNNDKQPVATTAHFENTIPNYAMEAIPGGVARDIINSMEKQLQQLPALHCRGRSAKERGLGAQHPAADPTGPPDLESA
jgi:hypothetical protein